MSKNAFKAHIKTETASGKGKKNKKRQAIEGIPTPDHTDREAIIRRLKEKK